MQVQITDTEVYMFDWINVIYSIRKEVRKMATQLQDLAGELSQIKNLVAEGMVEMTQKIADLEAALGTAGALPEDAQVELDSLKVMAQTLADVIANPPPVEEPPVE